MDVHAACAAVRAGLAAAADRVMADGMPVPRPEGKLLRPLVAYAALPPALRGEVDDEFWTGALAIQMVHEASLLHDDILDDAATRRGEPSVAARRGVATALVQGDHLLTSAYRVAAEAGIAPFLASFIRAVERTVAGEIAQQHRIGRALTPAEYRAAIEGKSGELFAASVALASARGAKVRGDVEAAGRRIGALYQMVDDALDYCPAAGLGKPALQDYRQRKWTFVLDVAGLGGFALDEDEVMVRLFSPGRGDGGRRVLARLESEMGEVLADFPHDDGLLAAVLEGWVAMAREAFATQRRTMEASRTRDLPTPASVEAEVVALARSVGDPDRWGGYFGRHSKSFRFAARLFPPGPARAVEGVYAFCRFTDDLVDEAEVEPLHARARLEAWRSLVRAAYEGQATGVPLADRVMGDAAENGVPLHYADELLTGVGMDLEPVCFERMSDLEVYTYRVASVVGGWITERFGIRDPEILTRAFSLGHAMQLTNILRDVGEDWRNDRLYLPRDVMERAAVDPAMVDRLSQGRGPVPESWMDLCEVLMGVADRHYAHAFAALPALPPFYARPVAVAARVYQGIHDEIRGNGYDNGTRRAYTRRTTKLRLGLRGLVDLRRARASTRTSAGFALAPQDG